MTRLGGKDDQSWIQAGKKGSRITQETGEILMQEANLSNAYYDKYQYIVHYLQPCKGHRGGK